MAGDIKIGRTAFMDKMGVDSELAYKKQCLKDNRIMIIHQLLAEAGADMINLGAETDPVQIISEAQHSKAEAILISTHNGMALDYARRLKEHMDRCKVTIPVVLGGILNQKVENQALPVDVSGDLKQLGFNPCPKLEGNFRKLLESNL